MINQIEPWIDEVELEQLKRVVKSTYVVEHDLTCEFEEKIKELTKSRFAVSMTNGTAALYCCLKSLGIGPGDEVIVPNFTFIASANAVIMAGATPVFCEVLPTTFCIDLNRAEALVTPKTKALIPVHIYGQSADMDGVMQFAKKYRLKVVEDAAQGVGVKFKDKHVGTFGELGILSFYGNKTITCGEGGVVLTDNEELARACYRLKNHGRDRKGVFVHETIGFNFAFTEMQAAIGIAQLSKLNAISKKKAEIHDRYVVGLASISKDLEPVFIDQRCTPVFWFTSFLSDKNEALAAHLRSFEIQTRRFFYPLHQQPCYQNVVNTRGDFSVSESIYRRGISLPSAYSLSETDQSLVIEKILGFYASRL